MRVPNLSSRPLLDSRPVWFVTGVTAVLALVLTVANVSLILDAGHETDDLRSEVERLRADRGQLADDLRRATGELEQVRWRPLEAEVAAMNELLDAHAFSWLRLLSDLERVLPWNVRLEQVQPGVEPGGVRLSLSGVAMDRDALLNLLDRMIADPRFERPLPLSETTLEGGGGEGYEFVLEAQYRPGGVS